MASVPKKRSALHHVHLARLARMVDESGWQLPAVYTTVDQEVEAVRKGAGLTDTSPLGKIDLRGPDTLAFLKSLFASGVPDPVGTMDRLPNGEMTGFGGGLCARLSGDQFYLVTPAAGLDSDLAALTGALARHPGDASCGPSPQLHRGQAHERENEGHNPETYDHLGLFPADQFEVVV